ncbi:MAG: hypothetical protein R3B67_03475 [Phycisphaerales bacterium]
MSDAPLILGVSGLRGIVGESLTPEVAVRYAASFGRWLRARSPQEMHEYGPSLATGVWVAVRCYAVSARLLSVGCAMFAT